MNAPLPTADDGWIEWTGGECPVADDVRVEVTYRGPPSADEWAIYSTQAGFYEWYHDGENDDIVAYRVLP